MIDQIWPSVTNLGGCVSLLTSARQWWLWTALAWGNRRHPGMLPPVVSSSKMRSGSRRGVAQGLVHFSLVVVRRQLLDLVYVEVGGLALHELGNGGRLLSGKGRSAAHLPAALGHRTGTRTGTRTNTIPNGTEANAAGVKWARVRGAYEVRREGGCVASAEVQGA